MAGRRDGDRQRGAVAHAGHRAERRGRAAAALQGHAARRHGHRAPLRRRAVLAQHRAHRQARQAQPGYVHNLKLTTGARVFLPPRSRVL